MIRVTTLYASTAVSTAKYYTRYLADAPGELPGHWAGHQADLLGLNGTVTTEALERLLSGHDPTSDIELGMPLKDRTLANGKTIRAVAGFDATVSAPLCRTRHKGAYAECVIMPSGEGWDLVVRDRGRWLFGIIARLRGTAPKPYEPTVPRYLQRPSACRPNGTAVRTKRCVASISCRNHRPRREHFDATARLCRAPTEPQPSHQARLHG